MESSPSIKILIQYQENLLPQNEKNALEAFLAQNPHYFSILKGLRDLRKHLNPDQDLEQYLDEIKEKLKGDIFPFFDE